MRVSCRHISFVVSELARDDAALVATLQGSAESLRPGYLYEAKMAFLLAVAQTRDGARALLDAGVWEPCCGPIAAIMRGLRQPFVGAVDCGSLVLAYLLPQALSNNWRDAGSCLSHRLQARIWSSASCLAPFAL